MYWRLLLHAVRGEEEPGVQLPHDRLEALSHSELLQLDQAQGLEEIGDLVLAHGSPSNRLGVAVRPQG